MPQKKKRAKPTFGICVNNENCPTSLELMKLYEIVSDPEAEAVYEQLALARGSGRIFP